MTWQRKSRRPSSQFSCLPLRLHRWSAWLSGQPSARNNLSVIFLALATVIPAASQQVLIALMEGAQRFDLQFYATLTGAGCQIGIVGCFAKWDPTIEGFLLATILSAATLTGVMIIQCWPMAQRHSFQSHQIPADLSRRIFSFSLSVFALWLLNTIVFDKSELFVLRIRQTPDQIAYYSIAFGLTARLGTVGDSIAFVLFPAFVSRLAGSGQDGLRELYKKSVLYLQMLMVPFLLLCIPIVPRLITLAFGAQYDGTIHVIQVLLGAMCITATMTVNTSVLYALDKQRSLFPLMIAVSILNLILDFALIPRYGAFGAAFANGLSQALAAVGFLVLIGRFYLAVFLFGTRSRSILPPRFQQC